MTDFTEQDATIARREDSETALKDENERLRARVAELEAIVSDSADMIKFLNANENSAVKEARLQGLREAKETVLSLWACRTCAEVADAIEALINGAEQ